MYCWLWGFNTECLDYRVSNLCNGFLFFSFRENEFLDLKSKPNSIIFFVRHDQSNRRSDLKKINSFGSHILEFRTCTHIGIYPMLRHYLLRWIKSATSSVNLVDFSECGNGMQKCWFLSKTLGKIRHGFPLWGWYALIGEIFRFLAEIFFPYNLYN